MDDLNTHSPLPRDDADTPEKAIAKIRNASLEHLYFFKNGKQICRFTGESDRVTPEPRYLSAMKDCVVIHNHPNGSSFSISDIEAIVTGNAKALLVVTQLCVYLVVRPKEGWNIDFSDDTFNHRLEESITLAESLIDKLVANNELPFYEMGMEKTTIFGHHSSTFMELIMPKKTIHTPPSAFDDRDLPNNPVSKLSAAEREKLETVAMSLLQAEWEKLRLEKPDLFSHTPTETIGK